MGGRLRVRRLMTERREAQTCTQYGIDHRSMKHNNSKKECIGHQNERNDDEDSKQDYRNAVISREKARELDEKLKRLEDFENSMAMKEAQLMAASRAAEERVAEMARQFGEMQERAKRDQADFLAHQELLRMASGPISERSEYRSGRNSHQPSSRSYHDSPPTARSARQAGGIPPNAPRRTYNGDEVRHCRLPN